MLKHVFTYRLFNNYEAFWYSYTLELKTLQIIAALDCMKTKFDVIFFQFCSYWICVQIYSSSPATTCVNMNLFTGDDALPNMLTQTTRSHNLTSYYMLAAFYYAIISTVVLHWKTMQDGTKTEYKPRCTRSTFLTGPPQFLTAVSRYAWHLVFDLTISGIPPHRTSCNASMREV